MRQQPDSDLLEWNLLPTEYEYTIDNVEATILYPEDINLLQPPAVTRGEAQVQTAPGEVTFTAVNVGPNEPLTVALHFPPGTMITAPPQWQARQVQASQTVDAVLPFAAGVGILTALFGSVLFIIWGRRAGQPESSSETLPKQMSPPATQPPAFAGLLAKKSEEADWSHALSTLIDLSRRGYVQMVETRGGLFKSQSYEIHLLKDPDEISQLRPHERGLLELLFLHRDEWRTEVSAQDLSSVVAKHFKQYKDPLKSEMEEQGYIHLQRRSTRNRMYVLGLVLFLVGMFLAFGGAIFAGISSDAARWPALQTGIVLAALFAGIGVAGITGLIMATTITPLSDAILQQAARWESFATYLKDVTRNREPVVRPDLFEAYLPYAASFGLAEAWSKYFQKQGMQQAPAWFTSSVGEANMGAFIAVIAATDTSGASSAGGGAGGGGAGGGGGSGAG
jgi:uncharacterized membrane protein